VQRSSAKGQSRICRLSSPCGNEGSRPKPDTTEAKKHVAKFTRYFREIGIKRGFVCGGPRGCPRKLRPKSAPEQSYGLDRTKVLTVEVLAILYCSESGLSGLAQSILDALTCNKPTSDRSALANGCSMVVTCMFANAAHSALKCGMRIEKANTDRLNANSRSCASIRLMT
jgi:hypothetical protein